MQDRRDAEQERCRMGGMQVRRNAGQMGCMQGWKNAGEEGCMKGGMQDWRDLGLEDAGQEGCRIGEYRTKVFSRQLLFTRYVRISCR